MRVLLSVFLVCMFLNLKLFAQTLKINLKIQSYGIPYESILYSPVMLKNNIGDYKLNKHEFLKSGLFEYDFSDSICPGIKLQPLRFIAGITKDSEYIIIPDLNYDFDFDNDIVINYGRGYNPSATERKLLYSKVQPIKVILHRPGADIKENEALYLKLFPHFCFTYSLKHPPKTLEDSLLFAVTNSTSFSGECNFRNSNFRFRIENPKLISQFCEGSNLKLYYDKVFDSTDNYVRLNDTFKIENQFYKFSYVDKFGGYILLDSIYHGYYRNSFSIGDKAKEFASIDMDDRPFRIRKLQNPISLLYTWYVGCGACHEIIPDLQYIKSKYSKNGLKIFGICLTRKEVAVPDISKFKMTWRNIQNRNPSNKSFEDIYHIVAYPTIILIDRNQKIIFRDEGIEAMIRLKIFLRNYAF